MKTIPKLYDTVKLKRDLDHMEHYTDRGYVEGRTGVVISEPETDNESIEVQVEFSEYTNVNIEDLEVIENNTNLLKIYLINKSDVEQISRKEVILFTNQTFNKKDLITGFKQSLSEDVSQYIKQGSASCGCHLILEIDKESSDDIIELFIEYLLEQGFSFYEKNEEHIPSIVFEIDDIKHINPIFSDLFKSYDTFFINDNKFIFSDVVFKEVVSKLFQVDDIKFETITIDLINSDMFIEYSEDNIVHIKLNIFDILISNRLYDEDIVSEIPLSDIL
jgi:hypothetical protein